jgi:uncharacterized membrane protein YgcG
MLNITRILRHLLMGRHKLRKALPAASLKAIETEIKRTEANHCGEIRFAVEASLDVHALLQNQSARERAIEVFSLLRVWDTEHNNGVLIYLLLADRDIEIVADRGIHMHVGEPRWERICQEMETHFKDGRYEQGVIKGIQMLSEHLHAHFPGASGPNEISDQAAML